MRNPLYKRIPKELKNEFGKYFVIFAFMVLLIGLVSSFLVVTNSMIVSYNESFEKYNIEDGHITFNQELSPELMDRINEKGNITLVSLPYINTTSKENRVRLYPIREEMNLACLMKGQYPSSTQEIAIDRLYAQNNEYEIGDEIDIAEKQYYITGFIALPDYSCLFEKNTDSMFNATNFSIALLTKEGFEAFNKVPIQHNYAWKYQQNVERGDDKANQDAAEALLETVKGEVKCWDEELVKNAMESGDLEKIQNVEKELLVVNDYLPQYKNQAINFTGEDMGSDKAMFIVFDYLVTLMIAFVFAVTISNTIIAEAGVIGTLRASGYTKGELIRHYMILPILVTLFAALIGNILGYTVLKQTMVNLYYDSYSLTTYHTLWNGEAFVLTTVVPIVIMFFVNLFVLQKKLKLSPIRFLKHDLTKKGKKKAFRLNTKIPIMHRFRIRVLFQNIPNYLTLFFGIFLGGIVIVFGMMFGPLFEQYKEIILEQRICDYQYVVMSDEAQTSSEQAEKYCQKGLNISYKDFLEDEVSVYGIIEDSKYVKANLKQGEVAISSCFEKKYGFEVGDTFELVDTYVDKTYSFKVAKIYEYDVSLSVFMTRADFNEKFEKSENYFTGYFSNNILSDIPEEQVATVISAKDLTKLADQMIDSMGGMMKLMKYFGIIMYLLLMYLLSKQIIEKNANSISMTKILGFYDGEIGSIYIVATSFVIVLSLALTCPLIDISLRAIFKGYLYKVISGYLPFIASVNGYLTVIGMGVGCYAVIAALQMWKIGKISKVEALKNVE